MDPRCNSLLNIIQHTYETHTHIQYTRISKQTTVTRHDSTVSSLLSFVIHTKWDVKCVENRRLVESTKDKTVISPISCVSPSLLYDTPGDLPPETFLAGLSSPEETNPWEGSETKSLVRPTLLPPPRRSISLSASGTPPSTPTVPN